MRPRCWYVKLARGEWETVLFTLDDVGSAVEKAAELNTRFQTDEYYVEPHDTEKAWSLE